MDKAINWAVIKTDDAAALRSYTFFLRSCFDTMDEAGFVEELENSTNMRMLVSLSAFLISGEWVIVKAQTQSETQRSSGFP